MRAADGPEVTLRAIATVSLLAASLLLGVTQVGCHRGSRSLEQIALDEFVSKHWGPEIFVGQCTGLEFDPRSPVRVFTAAPGYAISLLDLATLAPIDLESALRKKGGLDSLKKLGVAESGFGPVDLRAYPFTTASSMAPPEDNWQPADGYLLRFSNRVRFQDRIYLQLRIKSTRFSSGRRIDFQFDEAGRLVQSRKVNDICDDWG